MPPFSSSPRGMYFEQFELGQRIISAGRTITEADIVSFAGLSGDFTSIHTDAEFAKGTPFGQRVAHGLLIMSIASGLAVRTGIIEGTVLAFREVNDWKFGRPVYIGDTIHAEIDVTEIKALPRLGGGAVTMSVNVKNQKDESTMKGVWVMLVASRPK
jgi:3-hydroxybutyryl-CoA dehydratase